MIITVGSTNPVKVQAVEEVFTLYPDLAQSKIISLAVPSEVAEQPLSLSEIIRGAKNRAKNAFLTSPCTYGIGLESGLFEAPGAKTGFLEACICAIYDGSTHFLGLSPGFEVPLPMLELVLHKKMDLSQACHTLKISNDPSIGKAEGLIGILTRGRITRKEYTKQSLIAALIQIENHPLYLP